MYVCMYMCSSMRIYVCICMYIYAVYTDASGLHLVGHFVGGEDQVKNEQSGKCYEQPAWKFSSKQHFDEFLWKMPCRLEPTAEESFFASAFQLGQLVLICVAYTSLKTQLVRAAFAWARRT